MAENDKPAEVVNPNKDIIIEDMVLTVIHCWMQKTAREIVHKTAQKGFSLEDIRAAAEKLSAVGHQFVETRGSGIRSKLDLFLDDI